MADGMGRWSLSNAFTRKGKSSNNLARDLAAQVAQVKKESAKGAAGHLRARDIVHVNTGAWRLKLLQEILHGPPAIVLMVFLIMYVLTAMIFAGARLQPPVLILHRLRAAHEIFAPCHLSTHRHLYVVRQGVLQARG
jgi:hypothetical protein